jgi:hypothetical protein
MSKRTGTFDWAEGVTLKEYFCTKLGDLEERINIKFEDADKALELQQKTYEIRHEQLVEKIETLQRFMFMVIGALVVIEVFLKFLIK